MAYCSLADLKEQIKEDDLASLTDDRTNLTSDTLAAEATASAVTLTLTDSTGLPMTGRVEIDTEQIDYTGNSSNQLTGCTRGANDTTATAHVNGSTVTELPYINTDVIDRAIVDADSVIDDYSSSQYVVPFSPTPNIIRKFSVDLAIYNLCSRRNGANEDRLRRRNDTIAHLSDIKNGSITIGDATVSIDSTVGPESSLTTDDLIFTTGHNSDSSTGTLDNF